MYLVGVGAVSTLSMPFGAGPSEVGPPSSTDLKPLEGNTASFNGTTRVCMRSAGSVDMHRYGLVAAEDGEAPNAHMWQRMSNLSVAVLGDCVDFVPRRPVRTPVSVSWQVG